MTEGYVKEAPRAECKASYTPDRISWRVPNVHADILDISPRLSYYNPTINLERRLHGRNSPKIEEFLSRSGSCCSIDDAVTDIDQKTSDRSSQCVPDLINEIAALETEVVLLERHLLSLYRNCFVHYTSNYFNSSIKEENLIDRKTGIQFDQVHKPSSESASSCSSPNRRSPVNSSSSTNEISEPASTSQSAVGHLEDSVSDNTMTDPCNLSQDILKCLASIYCKMANKVPDHDLISPSAYSSTAESVSFSSVSASKDQHDDSWSPEVESVTDVNSPCKGSVVISEMCIDSDKFSHASKMLEILRSLVRCLSRIDPRKMEDREKIAFWINVHNALVMHALLAYGFQDNKLKRTYLVLKAAYDVGGKSITAHTIRTSILGCESNCQSKLVFTLLSPTKRFVKGHKRHPYSLSKPQPLCHFALCTGATSDPVLRVYTAEGVHKELESAKVKYIQESVRFGEKDKIALPKILHCYAKDASFELRDILEMVCKCMNEPERKVIVSCLSKKPEKCVEWLPFKTSFRYVVNSNLATT